MTKANKNPVVFKRIKVDIIGKVRQKFFKFVGNKKIINYPEEKTTAKVGSI